MTEDLKSPSTLPFPYDRLCFARILVGSLHVSISLLKQIASFFALTHTKEEEEAKKKDNASPFLNTTSIPHFETEIPLHSAHLAPQTTDVPT